MPKQSKLLALPKSVPIDWFDPIYWNEHLTLHEHADYIQGGVHVALPRDPHLYSTWSACVAWKNLPVKEFMDKYGNDVLTHTSCLLRRNWNSLTDMMKSRRGRQMGQKRVMMMMMIVMTGLRMQNRSRYILLDLACLALCNKLVAASSTSMLSTDNQTYFNSMPIYSLWSL